MDRCAVGAEEVLVVVEERPQARPVFRHQPRIGTRPGDAGPQDRVQVQGPGVVVVELAAVAVGVPAVPPVPVLQAGQARVDLGAAVRGADGGEELLGDDLEQPPVGVVDDRSDEAAQPVGDPLPYAVVEPVPDPGARLVQGDRDGRGLDHGLAAVGDGRPAVGAVRVGAGRESDGVPLDQVGPPSARPGDAEGGQQEGAGEALQSVGPGPGVAGRSGEAVLGEAPGGVGGQGVEEAVGDRLPVGPGPAGDRRGQRVGRRQLGEVGRVGERHVRRAHAGVVPPWVTGRARSGAGRRCRGRRCGCRAGGAPRRRARDRAARCARRRGRVPRRGCGRW